MKIITLILLLSLSLAQQCNKGGLLCTQGKCHYPRYVEGCLNYGLDDSCSECQYNYQLKNGVCFYSSNNYGLDCCAKFDNSSFCIQCSKGLLLNPATGLCEDKKIIGCIQKNQNGCIVCASNFDLISGICVKTVVGCTALDKQFNCISCDNSSTFYNGVCVPITNTVSIKNCQTNNQFGCAECIYGYRLDIDGSCKPSGIVGCLKYNLKGECIQCFSPYYQLLIGRCAIVGCLQTEGLSCKLCDSSYGFILNNQRCQIPNCLYFSPTGCSLCKNGLVAGSWGCKTAGEKVCLICKVDEFLGKDGICYKKDVHCSQYKNGICQKCCDTYFLNANFVCEVKQFGCVYANGQCNSCLVPFIFNSNKCLIQGCLQYCDQGCKKCDSRLILNNFICVLPNCIQISGISCVKCSNGFQFDSSNNCVSVDPYCSIKNSLNQCLKCQDGYQLNSDGRCIVSKLGCNYVDGRCTSCRAPFMYVPESESCQIDGCLTYFIGGCNKCTDGYNLLYNSCKISNCLVSKLGKCLQCDPDYVFRSDGVCVSKDQYCDKMDEYGTCIKCMSSYYYSQKQHKCIKRSPGCNYDDQDNCITCQSPFSFNNGRCSIAGCLNMIEDGCAQCQYPYQLTSSKICNIPNCQAYNNGRCVSCVVGFVLNQKNLCETQDPYCFIYNNNRTFCQKCVKGYRLDCDGKCEYSDEHCWDFDSFGICMNCDRLFYLNSYGKCQLRDPQCLTYTNGFCSSCKSYYFVQGGVCMANLKGCQIQKSYSQCLTCDDTYILKNGVCSASITQLSWNSIDMDFYDGATEKEQEDSKNTFTVSFTNTSNLIQALGTGKANVFYSVSTLNNAQYQVDTAGTNGWSTNSQSIGQFIGIQVKNLQTFYAVDVKSLTGSTLKTFAVQYSLDGKNFITVGDFNLQGIPLNVVKTFYFKPVDAYFIRILVKEGVPNIKFDFYFSDYQKLSKSDQSNNSSYISKIVSESIDGISGGVSTCSDNGLCWAGVQACEPRKIKGFSLIYTTNSATDFVTEVKIDSSIDGIHFDCWNSCNSVPLLGSSFVFPVPILAEKMHVHFSKYTGNPKFGIRFDWA